MIARITRRPTGTTRKRLQMTPTTRVIKAKIPMCGTLRHHPSTSSLPSPPVAGTLLPLPSLPLLEDRRSSRHRPASNLLRLTKAAEEEQKVSQIRIETMKSRG